MAHAGRFYKLHFRRDMGIVLGSNQLSLPEAFMARCIITKQIPTFPPVTIENWLHKANYEQPDPITWVQTELRDIYGKKCYLRIHHDGFDLPSQTVKLRVDIENQARVRASVQMVQTTKYQCGYYTCSVILDREHGLDVDFWNAFQMWFVIQLRPATWAEWQGE